jgi:tetratricopeptide (TPR) repeat protein
VQNTVADPNPQAALNTLDAGVLQPGDAGDGGAVVTNALPIPEAVPEVDAGVRVPDPAHVAGKPKPRNAGPPRNEKEAQRLLSQARGLAGNMKWDDAREKYERVVSGRFLKQQGYLGLADVAFQNKNAELAIKFAKKAGNSIPAQLALGNGYFKKGDYKAALQIYNKVLAKKPGHKEAQSSAKEARARMK